MNLIIKNFKTSISGVLVIICIILNFCNVITVEQLTVSTGLFVSLGLLASKDSEK